MLPNCNADRISSKVVPFAPFIVMPSANDALRGETNTLSAGSESLIVRQRATEYEFAAVIVFCTLGVSARGSCVSAGRGAPGSGCVESLQATPATTKASAGAINRRREIIKTPTLRSFELPSSGQ